MHRNASGSFGSAAKTATRRQCKRRKERPRGREGRERSKGKEGGGGERREREGRVCKEVVVIEAEEEGLR